jgi:hypothetical protein
MNPTIARPHGMLVPGRRYRVTKNFTDYDGDQHLPGESWIYLGHNFLPYDNGLSLFVSLDANQEWHIRMQWRAGEQGIIIDHFQDYLVEVRPELTTEEPPHVQQPPTAPSFYLTSRRPIPPGVVLLAIVVAVSALFSILYAMDHAARTRLNDANANSASATPGTSSAADDKDEKDDPSQIDTIVLGDPADAPVPGRRAGRVSPVHPTIVVRLPRFGDQVGLIPNTPAGQLLYGWLAAFNQASSSALSNILIEANPDAVAAQMELRQQTGGFNLLSAKEVQPGILVFRLRDQTPMGAEALGTLQVRPDSSPASIASFSLRDVPAPRKNKAVSDARSVASGR